jgi:hypothetical protein
MKITWPLSAAVDFAAWMRELWRDDLGDRRATNKMRSVAAGR